MRTLYFFISLAFLLNAGLAGAQVKMVDGNLGKIKAGSKMNTEFTYDNMGVGKFKTEEEYVNKKKEEYNNKEAGRGDRWANAWVADRKNRFEPAFITLFSKHVDLNAGNYPEAEYTLIFNTSFTEPGFNVGVWRSNAYISGTAKIVETKNRDKVVAEFTVNKMPGRDVSGYDFDTGERIEEAYSKAGKELGQLMKKKMK
jgi:hypothetical protein